MARWACRSESGGLALENYFLISCPFGQCVAIGVPKAHSSGWLVGFSNRPDSEKLSLIECGF